MASLLQDHTQEQRCCVSKPAAVGRNQFVTTPSQVRSRKQKRDAQTPLNSLFFEMSSKADPNVSMFSLLPINE